MKELVFDFDGTIADSMEEVVKVMNRIAPEYGFPLIGEKEIEIFRNIGSKKSFKVFKVRWWHVIRVGRRIVSELNKEMGSIKMFVGMDVVLKTLHNEGFKIGILSSDSKKNINVFLEKYGLKGMFDYVESCGLIWGKRRGLFRIMKKRKLKPEELIYIGDETKDIIACKKAGVKMLAVGWGWNSKAALASYAPEYMVSSPSEIIEVINHDFKRGIQRRVSRKAA